MSPTQLTVPHSAPTLGDEEAAAVDKVLRSGAIAQGDEVAALETECAAFSGHTFGVALSSGTAALHMALAALGVKPGDPVGAPSYACAALATAIRLQGAIPFLFDAGEDFNPDLSTVPEPPIPSIGVHLFGKKAPQPKSGFAIDDVAQSFGGATGNQSPVSVTSFYATKLMTTGEGGMLLTNDEEVAGFARDRRDYDNRDTFVDRFNYKMTDLQAAMGRVQLRRLPGFIARRRAIATRYTDAFADLPLRLPDGEGHVYFRYVVSTEDRAGLENHLQARGIAAKRPVHMPSHRYFQGTSGEENVKLLNRYPGAEAAHRSALSLPIYPSMIAAQIRHVIESTLDFFR